MISKMRSFLTTLCPRCGYRRGSLVLGRRRRDRFLNRLFIYLFECHSCNLKFHALSFKRR
jgi:transposase